MDFEDEDGEKLIGTVFSVTDVWQQCYVQIEDANDPEGYHIRLDFDEIENGIPNLNDLVLIMKYGKCFRAKILERYNKLDWSKEGF